MLSACCILGHAEAHRILTAALWVGIMTPFFGGGKLQAHE